MDEEQTKSCPNCKRDIPSVNYTIHTAHCARNIRMCPVCKEPVPLADLDKHHDELHKQLPCKQCGESVCGTDLEDHLRDSCANTIKSCRFCELELARRELPAHEGYCGVRTEQCSDCREWVMIKYRQLHLDSNHGFLRLDDDPAPVPRKDPPNVNVTRPLANCPSTSNGVSRASYNNGIRNINEIRNSGLANINLASGAGPSHANVSKEHPVRRAIAVGSEPDLPFGKVTSKRTNDQPQINLNAGAPEKVVKDLPSRGAVKKRPAPRPPIREPPADPRRDLPYYSALERHQNEEKKRQEQNAYNNSVGLPPVLNPAQKVEKLRKMDALQNRETLDNDYKNRLRGNVWAGGEPPDCGNVAGHLKKNCNTQTDNRPQRFNVPGPSQRADNVRPLQNINLASASSSQSKPSNKGLKNKNLLGTDNQEIDRRREEFKNLKPMSQEEFREMLNKLQLTRDGEDVRRDRRGDRNGANSGDRFSEIKSSLRELRRDLNEVTAPYNANPGTFANNFNNENLRLSPAIAMDVSEDDENEVELLPCEFCGAPVPMEDLVQHQTGCRPDLAQFRPSSPDSSHVARGYSPQSTQDDLPVIPCEFCTESLPVYLFTEHQKRCGPSNNHGVIYLPE